MTRVVELTEFKPREIPKWDLDSSDVDALYQRFGKQINIDSPGPANGWCWRLVSAGWIGYGLEYISTNFHFMQLFDC